MVSGYEKTQWKPFGNSCNFAREHARPSFAGSACHITSSSLDRYGGGVAATAAAAAAVASACICRHTLAQLQFVSF